MDPMDMVDIVYLVDIMDSVFSLSLFVPGYFSPRRGYSRVLKFCVGFKVTKKIRFGVNTNFRDPPDLWGLIFSETRKSA